jgi:hypothetical protein
MDFKALIKTAAPWIGAALPGPLGGIATNAINMALGNSPDTKVGDIEKSFAAGTITGDQMVALKAQDQKFQETMKQLGFEDLEKLESIAAADRADARQREIKTGDWTPKALAFVITAGFFAILAFMCTHELPPMAHDGLLLLLGSLGTAWVQVVTYYYGSSAGSDKKSDLLAQAPAIEKK